MKFVAVVVVVASVVVIREATKNPNEAGNTRSLRSRMRRGKLLTAVHSDLFGFIEKDGRSL